MVHSFSRILLCNVENKEKTTDTGNKLTSKPLY